LRVVSVDVWREEFNELTRGEMERASEFNRLELEGARLHTHVYYNKDMVIQILADRRPRFEIKSLCKF
jgi:hypothetical protein